MHFLLTIFFAFFSDQNSCFHTIVFGCSAFCLLIEFDCGTVVLQGTRVSGEDVIIGKTTPISQEEAQGQAARYSRRDHSISLRHSENGIVDQVSFV